MGKRTEWLAKAALLLAALIWGSSFFIMKNSVDAFPTFTLLAIRFLVGAALLTALFWKKLRLVNRQVIVKGALLGVLLFAAYAVQTFGLIRTTPGKNAFLTAVYCVLVPFLCWLMFKRRPTLYHFMAAMLCIAGIGLVSLEGDLRMNSGDALTLVGGVFYAFHMIAVSKFSGEEDVFMLTMIQFLCAGILCTGLGLMRETFPTELTVGNWAGVAYLAVFATTAALLMQNVGQKYTSPQSASILLSLESVFGVLFSVIFYHEAVTFKLLVGFALIFAAVLVSEYTPKVKLKEEQA